ncbi:MAG: hypothetical protein KDD69_18695, partial [Bdellovibrionales bacterium]|nr:hypothetical protein [Bdellovibrionales bacterium]
MTTDARSRGAWTGGVTIYKPDLRRGPIPFGEGFDFALYYPFSNAHETALTVPINTFRLGTLPDALIANWFSISDATPGDGFGIRGTIFY